MKLKILITGANGLLGRHALFELKKIYDVHAIVFTLPEEPVDGIQYHIIDLASNWSPSQLPSAINTVIHLAQSSKFRDFPQEALDVFRVNVDSTVRLLDYCVQTGVEKFIYTSSGGVYGIGSGAFYENSPLLSTNKLGFYLGSKVCSEVLAQSYTDLMDIVILRPFFMYGSGQRCSMLIPRLVDNIRGGLLISLQGSSGLHINPVHVSDAVRLLNKCMDLKGSQVINLAGPDVLSLKEISEIIAGKLNVVPCFEYIDEESKDLIGDNTLMETMLDGSLIEFKKGVVDIL